MLASFIVAKDVTLTTEINIQLNTQTGYSLTAHALLIRATHLKLAFSCHWQQQTHRRVLSHWWAESQLCHPQARVYQASSCTNLLVSAGCRHFHFSQLYINGASYGAWNCTCGVFAKGLQICSMYISCPIINFFSHLNTDDWTPPLGAHSSLVKHRSETNPWMQTLVYRADLTSTSHTHSLMRGHHASTSNNTFCCNG